MLEAAVVAGLASAGADAVRVGVLPTPAVAFLVAALGRRPRRDDLRVAQRDARQRHQAVRRRRAQAARRRRGRDRGRAGPAPAPGPTGAAIGRVRDLPDAVDRYIEPPARRHARPARRAARSWSTARTAPRPRSPRRPTAGPAPRSSRCTPSRTGSTSTTASARPTSARCARPCVDATAPTWASPTTATPTAASPSTPPAPWWTATRSWPCSRVAMREAGELATDTLVATVMSNLGLHIAMREAGITVRTTAGRRPLRARGAAARAGSASAASSPGTSCCPTTPPPATACSPRCG